MSQDSADFMLDVDASNYVVGAVLQQEQDGLLRVIGYASETFTATEQRYCITRKELAGMIFGLKHYRKYLLGRQFTIRTDHAALSYLLTAKDLIGQQARWVELLSEYTFTIQHRAGKSHSNADALSRILRARKMATRVNNVKNTSENCLTKTQKRAKKTTTLGPSQPVHQMPLLQHPYQLCRPTRPFSSLTARSTTPPSTLYSSPHVRSPNPA